MEGGGTKLHYIIDLDVKLPVHAKAALPNMLQRKGPELNPNPRPSSH